MDEKLDLLFEKVERVADLLDLTRRHNAELKDENNRLKTELAEVNRELEALRLTSADQAGRTRTKLLTVLDRLDQLEKLGA
jgi:FtsZ-binding cell division protein ZapB